MYSYQKHLYGLFSPYLIERKKETFKKFYEVQSESVNIFLNILSSIIFNHLNGNEKVGEIAQYQCAGNLLLQLLLGS